MAESISERNINPNDRHQSLTKRKRFDASNPNRTGDLFIVQMTTSEMRYHSAIEATLGQHPAEEYNLIRQTEPKQAFETCGMPDPCEWNVDVGRISLRH